MFWKVLHCAEMLSWKVSSSICCIVTLFTFIQRSRNSLWRLIPSYSEELTSITFWNIFTFVINNICIQFRLAFSGHLHTFGVNSKLDQLIQWNMWDSQLDGTLNIKRFSLSNEVSIRGSIFNTFLITIFTWSRKHSRHEATGAACVPPHFTQFQN